MDQRDDQTWVVIELSHAGEVKMSEGTLAACLRRDLGVQPDFPIFIPVMSYPRGARSVNVYLMEGYVFVGSGLPETSYFALEHKDYVNHVVSTPGRVRSLGTIPNKKIEELKNQLRSMVASNIKDGDHVTMINGSYRNLDGDVIHVYGDNAIVRVQLRSLDMIATIPVIFMEVTPNQ